MNRERLGWIIENLEKEIPGTKFDMNSWHTIRQYDVCGTTHCAFGSLRNDLRASEAGLGWTPILMTCNEVRLAPDYKGRRGFSAVAMFLDMPVELVYKYFSTTEEYNANDRDTYIRILKELRDMTNEEMYEMAKGIRDETHGEYSNLFTQIEMDS